MDFYETDPVVVAEANAPDQTHAPALQEQTPPSAAPQAAPAPAPTETLFIGDSHASALARFSGVKGRHTGVNGAHIEQIIPQLEAAPNGSRVFMTAGTNDGVGQWDETKIRAHVARVNQIAQDRNLDVTWIGPTGPNAKRLDEVLANASTDTKLKYKSVAGVVMQMQKDGYHATIDDKGYGAMWRSLGVAQNSPSPQQVPAVPEQAATQQPVAVERMPLNSWRSLGVVAWAQRPRGYQVPKQAFPILTLAFEQELKKANEASPHPIPIKDYRAVAAAFIGNAFAESGFDSDVHHDNEGGRPTGYGLFGHRDPGHRPARRAALLRYLAENGYERSDPVGQVRFAANEALQRYRPLMMAASRVEGLDGAQRFAVLVRQQYEQPDPRVANDATRVRGAVMAYNLTNENPSPAATPRGTIDFSAPVQETSVNEAPSAPSAIQRMDATRKKNEAYDNSSYWQFLKDSWNHDTLTGRIIQNVGDHKFGPDPSFLLTPEVQAELQKQYNLSNESMSQLTSAVSKNHAHYLAGIAQEAEKRDALMASYGWTGLGMRVATAILDPVAIAAGAATGGLADMAVVVAQGGRIARVGAQLLAGASTNVGLDLAMRELGDPHATQNLALTATVGALFGASYGLIARNPATVEEAVMLQRSAASLKKSLEAAVPETATPLPNSSVGAALNPNANIPALDDAVINALTQDSAAKTAFGSFKFFGKEIPLRWSAVGQLGRTKDPLARIGASLAEDGVGKQGHAVNPFSRSEEAMLMYDRLRSDLYNTWGPSVTKWAEEQGVRVGARVRSASEFNQLVHKAVVDQTSTTYHPEVARVADKIRQLNAEILRLAQNPFERERLVGRAVRGFEEVPENPFYMMRIYDDAKVNRAREKFGDTGLQTLFRGAIKSAQTELDDEIIETLARHFVTRITRRANGVDDDFNRLINGDSEVLSTILRDVGVPEEELSTIMARWDSHKLSNQQGVDNRAKHRVLMDETFVVRNYPTSPEWRRANPNELHSNLTLSDLVLNDGMELSDRYFRHMSGRISMAKWRPTDEKSGSVLLNGITADGEFETFLKRIRESGNKHGLDKSEIQKNVDNLTFLYNRTVGRPDPSQLTEWGKWARRTRAAEHIRLGMNLGWAQLPEFVMPIAQVGLKATLSHVPALRRVVNMNGEEVLKTGLAREIESMFGRAHLPSGSYLRDEMAGGVAAGTTGKIDNALTLGVNAVNEMSGMNVINRTLITMTRHGMVQKFADMALDPSKANLERMASIGLSKPMLDRILKQLRNDKIVKREDGFSGKLTELNLSRWEDQEARAMFENAVWRWSRRVIQQNDVGQLHRWFSHPMWQMLLQFRQFPLVAWEKQFLHNMHLRDMHAFNSLWMSMATGTAVYVAQTHVQAIGRADKEAFLEKRLSLGQIAAGGFQRAGWSSIVPIVTDTGAAVTGFDPIFNARTTGQPSSLLGFPAYNHLDDISKAMRGVVQPWAEDRERSQMEYQSIVRAFTTWFPIVSFMSAITEDAPLYTPRNR